jgi:predicted aldo/keto reductase-like oxidoreductase
MEPLRGGRLANLSEEEKAVLHDLHPEESCIDWAFRFLQGLPNVKMILSGMSAYEQMVQNVETFQTEKPLNEKEYQTLMDLAEGMKNAVPCTACRYCCAGCPMQLDIPKLIAAYNDLHFAANLMTVMNLDALPEDKKASACIGCRKCTQVCPQNIEIPEVMKGLVAEVAKHPTWKDMSEQRAKEAEEIRKQMNS